MPFQFFFEDISPVTINEQKVEKWLTMVAKQHGHTVENICFIFCSDNYLLQINQNYLRHDYYTDVITFEYSEDNEMSDADIFISLDRVRENAKTYKVPFSKELLRVVVHGLLHILGFSDETDEKKLAMRKKEADCLSLLEKL